MVRTALRLAHPMTFLLLLAAGAAPASAASTLCVNPGGTGGCLASIQAAVDAAGTGTVIDVAPGSYLENVEVSTLKALTIQGSDAATTIVDGSAGAPGSDALRVAASRGAIAITGLTFRGASGAGLFAGGSRVLVADCVFADNGIAGLYAHDTTATVVRSRFEGNARGIFSRARGLRLDQSSVTGNGTGIAGWARKMVIQRSDVSHNAGYGLEIFTAPVTVLDSTIDGNFVGITKNDCNGGCSDAPGPGPVRIERTRVRGNVATGIEIGSYGRLTLVRSTVSGNGGAGITTDRPRLLSVLASTVSSNGGTGISYFAPTYSIGADPKITSTTVAGNGGPGVASTLHASSPRRLFIEGSILADNAQDCAGDVIATGSNLIEDPGGCVLTSAGDLTGVDPQLLPLADNGGPTETHALAPTSPVLGFVTVAKLCKPDQRGVKRSRPCDIGAFELP